MNQPLTRELLRERADAVINESPRYPVFTWYQALGEHMIRVSQKAFYSYVNGNRNVVIDGCYQDETIFKLSGGPVIGKTEGYKSDEKFYCLTQAAIDKLKQENKWPES